MLKIIKYGCEYNIDKKLLASINVTYDGLQIILNDQTELRFQFQVSNQIKALVPIIKSSNVNNITLNLDMAVAGRFENVLNLNQEQPPLQPQVIIGEIVSGPGKDTKTQDKPAKRPGRKPGQKTTKKS